MELSFDNCFSCDKVSFGLRFPCDNAQIQDTMSY